MVKDGRLREVRLMLEHKGNPNALYMRRHHSNTLSIRKTNGLCLAIEEDWSHLCFDVAEVDRESAEAQAKARAVAASRKFDVVNLLLKHKV